MSLRLACTITVREMIMGLYLLEASDEATIAGDTRVEDLPGKAELVARRNEDWYQDHYIGRMDVDGFRKRRTIRYIAGLYGCTKRTVRLGIARARETREAARNVARLESSG